MTMVLLANADDTGCQRDSGSDIAKEENNGEGDT